MLSQKGCRIYYSLLRREYRIIAGFNFDQVGNERSVR